MRKRISYAPPKYNLGAFAISAISYQENPSGGQCTFTHTHVSALIHMGKKGIRQLSPDAVLSDLSLLILGRTLVSDRLSVRSIESAIDPLTLIEWGTDT